MESKRTPGLGEVWLLNFDPRVGREQGGIRPALVISRIEFNSAPNGLYFVVPITTVDQNIPLHLRIEPPEGGLHKPSLIMCDQARAQREERFLRMRGVVTPAIVALVQEMVGECIDR